MRRISAVPSLTCGASLAARCIARGEQAVNLIVHDARLVWFRYWAVVAQRLCRVDGAWHAAGQDDVEPWAMLADPFRQSESIRRARHVYRTKHNVDDRFLMPEH